MDKTFIENFKHIFLMLERFQTKMFRYIQSGIKCSNVLFSMFSFNHTFYAQRFLSLAHKELLHCPMLVLGAAGRRGAAPGGGAGGRGAGVLAVAAAVAGVSRGAAVAPPTSLRLL